MATKAEILRNEIIESGYVLDPEGTHHEFVSGMHGRKLDFDKISVESELFEQWVQAVAEKIHELYIAENLGKIMLLSVANGTNRLVDPVAETLGPTYIAALTEKETDKTVRLSAVAEHKLLSQKPDLVLAVEDVGTSGSTSSTAVFSARSAGAKRVEALNTWQRRPLLESLEAIGATYHSVIHEELPTYSPEECRSIG